jgi:hypothetical protein
MDCLGHLQQACLQIPVIQYSGQSSKATFSLTCLFVFGAGLEQAIAFAGSFVAFASYVKLMVPMLRRSLLCSRLGLYLMQLDGSDVR